MSGEMCVIFLFISGSELVVVLVAAWLLLGTRRLPETARFLGKSLREIRKATAEFKQEIADEGLGTAMDDVREAGRTLQDSIESGFRASGSPRTKTDRASSQAEAPEEKAGRIAREAASYRKYYSQDAAGGEETPGAAREEDAAGTAEQEVTVS